MGRVPQICLAVERLALAPEPSSGSAISLHQAKGALNAVHGALADCVGAPYGAHHLLAHVAAINS